MDTQASIKPSAKSLAQGSRAFIAENFESFKLYIKPLVLPMLACLLAMQVAQFFMPSPQAIKDNGIGILMHTPAYYGVMAISLIVIYIQACFALSWHRAVLTGARAEYAVNAFSLRPGDGPFILAFYAVGLIPVLFGMGGGTLLGIALLTHIGPLVTIAAILTAVLAVYGIIFAMRTMFILPARSIKENVGWNEARRLSRGLVWKLFAASFWWVVLVALLLGVWTLVIQSIGTHIFIQPGSGPFSPRHHSTGEFVYLFVFLGVPQMLVRFYITAFGVGILARLYQWSMQNHLPAMETYKEGVV